MSVSFSLSGVTARVQNPDLNNQLNLDPHQVVQPKASGGFYRFALADSADTRRELKWSNLRLSELNDVQGFFRNQAQGTLNEFTFTDERNVAWAAYFLSATLDPVTVADEAASTGSFVTGGDTVPTTVRSGGFYELTIKLHLRSGAPSTSSATSGPTSSPTAAGTSGPTSAPTSPPEYALESDLLSHTDLTTAAHGGIVASTDSRLTNARTPIAHAATHASTGSDPITPASIGADAAGAAAAAQSAAEAASVPLTAAGADNGVATLDASGKVPTTQLPAAILGALDYQGTYDCSGGSYPVLPVKGQYWVCSVAGTIGGVAYGIGDWLTYNGASWNRIDNQQVVSSVCGKVGAVTLSASDVGADASGAAAAAQTAAEAASIPAAALVTSVGSPGSDSNVPSEKAVRTALASAITTAESASDAAGAAAAAAAASVPNSALVTSVGSPGSDSNVPSEKAVRTALAAAISTAEAACDAAGAAAAAQSAAEAASDPAGSASTVQGNLNTHTALTTTAHGGIVASGDSRLTNARTPTAHEGTHLTGGGDVLALPDAIEFVIDGGGSAITTGVKGFLEIPFNCTIQRVTLLADQSGSIVVDVQTSTYAGFPTTSSIAASDLPTLSSAQKGQDSTLTGWSTSLAAGSIIAFKVNSAATVTRVTVSLAVVRA